jgi:hypothetical protein
MYYIISFEWVFFFSISLKWFAFHLCSPLPYYLMNFERVFLFSISVTWFALHVCSPSPYAKLLLHQMYLDPVSWAYNIFVFKLWLNKSMSSWWCFSTFISKRPIKYKFDCPFIFLEFSIFFSFALVSLGWEATCKSC